MKRLISTGLWVAALGAVPAVSPAADTTFDGKWTVNLKCSQHLENGRPAFARQFELTVSAGRISEAQTLGTGSGKEDTQWEGRVDAGVFSLNGPTQRADGTRWSLNFAGKANGKDRIAASGGLSSDQRKLRDCTLDLQLASPAPAAATAPLAAAPRPAVAAVAATVVAVAPASPTMVATAPTAPARAAAPAAAPTPSPSPPTNPSATTTAPTSTPRADLTPLEARVEDLLSRMTLSEAVGMLGDDGDNNSPCGTHTAAVPRLDVTQYRWLVEVSSMAGASDTCSALQPWHSGCPTSFPAAMLLTGSFNRTLWQLHGDVVGREMRALNNLLTTSAALSAGKMSLAGHGPDINNPR